jgi:hypothetical protein
MAKVEKTKFDSEAPISSQFLSDVQFPLGKQTFKGSSTVKKDGANKGKTLLRFEHESGVNFSMGMGDFRIACTKAGVNGCDQEGNILDVNSEKVSGSGYTVVG